MKAPDYDQQIRDEIQNAILAREKGNEGQARVCARRAAGIAVRKYYKRMNIPIFSKSAYELLLSLMGQVNVPQIARQNAVNLTMRVSDKFKLPGDVDLIDEASSLCEQLSNL